MHYWLVGYCNAYCYCFIESNGFCKGPRRVACFCILGVVSPVILVSIPLLMRFVVYGSTTYYLNPSDMRILDQRISTIWCKVSQTSIVPFSNVCICTFSNVFPRWCCSYFLCSCFTQYLQPTIGLLFFNYSSCLKYRNA